MIRLDLMLADYAVVQGGKLFISGAGIDTMGALPVDKVYRVSFAVGLTMKIPAAETNKDHELRISIIDSADETVILQASGLGDQTVEQEKLIVKFNLRPIEIMTSDDEFVVPLAFQLNGIALPSPGIYKLRAEIDDAISSLAQFRVSAPVQRPPTRITGQIESINSDTGVKFSGSGVYDLSDLRMVLKDNRVAIDIGDDVEVHDHDTIIE